jgi:phosphoglycerate dehydrogenase-like enzyme
VGVRVWVPYHEVVSQLPVEMAADVYDGTGEPPSTRDEVEFFVLPYTFDDTALKLMAYMPRLRVAQTLTAGVEHVLPHLPDGVRLCKAGGVHNASTAELALTLILAALRGVPAFVRAQDRAEWCHERHDALADKRVLIVGYGGVGIAVERRLAGFEVTVRRVARRAREGVSPVRDLPDLLPEADVVVLAVPLTDSTRGLVDRAFLARLPDHALVVNVARGAVIDTKALLAELNSGRLRAALDVMEMEPLPADDPLWHAPGVLLSPHVGGNTAAFLPRATRLIIDQLHRYAAGEALLHDVTPDDGAGPTLVE